MRKYQHSIASFILYYATIIICCHSAKGSPPGSPEREQVRVRANQQTQGIHRPNLPPRLQPAVQGPYPPSHGARWPPPAADHPQHLQTHSHSSQPLVFHSAQHMQQYYHQQHMYWQHEQQQQLLQQQQQQLRLKQQQLLWEHQQQQLLHQQQQQQLLPQQQQQLLLQQQQLEQVWAQQRRVHEERQNHLQLQMDKLALQQNLQHRERFSHQLQQRHQQLLDPQQHGRHQAMPPIPPHAWLAHSATSQPAVDWSYNPHEERRASEAHFTLSSFSSSAFNPFPFMHEGNRNIDQQDGRRAGQHGEITGPNVSSIIDSSSDRGAQEAEKKPVAPEEIAADSIFKGVIQSHKHTQQVSGVADSTPTQVAISSKMRAEKVPTPSANPLHKSEIKQETIESKPEVRQEKEKSKPENELEKKEMKPEVKPGKEEKKPEVKQKKEKHEIKQEKKVTKPQIEHEKEETSYPNDCGNMADKAGALNFENVPNVPLESGRENEPSSPTSTRQQISPSEQKKDVPKSPRRMAPPIQPEERVSLSSPNILPVPSTSSDVSPTHTESLDANKNSEKIGPSIETDRSAQPVETHRNMPGKQSPSKKDGSLRGHQSVIGKNKSEPDAEGNAGLHGGVIVDNITCESEGAGSQTHAGGTMQIHHPPKGTANPQSISSNEPLDDKSECSPSAQSTKTPAVDQTTNAGTFEESSVQLQGKESSGNNEEASAKMTSRQRRRQRERINKLAKEAAKIEKEREKELEKERAKPKGIEKEDHGSKRIDEVIRGGKGLVDLILASTPLGQMGSKSEDLRKELHTRYDKEMEATGREKIKQAMEAGDKEIREKKLTDNEAMKMSSNQIQPIDSTGFGKASDLKDAHTGTSSIASGSSSSSKLSKNIVDPIVVSIPLGKFSSKSEDFRKQVQKNLMDNIGATIIAPNQIQPVDPKNLEKERAKTDEMEKEDNENQKIDEVKRGEKDIVDTLVASTPLGKDFLKHVHTIREMREKNLADIEATKISSNQIQPNELKSIGQASDLKDAHTGKSSTASGLSPSKSSSSSGPPAHKQQKKKSFDHHKEIQEIFNQLHEEKISQIYTYAEINAWVKAENVEYLLETIEHFHNKLYNYWSQSYEVHHGTKHEEIATAIAKMAFYHVKGLSNKEVDSNIYENTVRSLKRAVIILAKIWMDPDTKGDISKRYENENFRFTNWMLSFDELIKELNNLYEKIKIYHKKKMMDEPFKQSKEYFEAEIKMDKSLNEILRKALGMIIIGFYDENLETMKKKDVFVGINNLELWLPGYKDKVQRARMILWNYFKIEKEMLEMEIDAKFGKYFKIIFDSELPIGDYMDVNTTFSDKYSKAAVKEISDFILKKESETPKDVVDSLLALKEHILCVHFMMKMHKNMENDKVKSKMNEEERNAFWTIVDKEKLIPSVVKFLKANATICGSNYGLNMNKVNRGLDSVRKLKDDYNFDMKRTEASGDLDECKPKEGYEDYSAERKNSEEIKPGNVDVEAKDQMENE